LERHLQKTKLLFEEDLEEGFGEVFLPFALERKYPRASKQWAWQEVFPAARRSRDPRDPAAPERRHQVAEVVLQRAVKEAVRRSGIARPVTCHTFRHSFATHLLEKARAYPITQILGDFGDEGVAAT